VNVTHVLAFVGLGFFWLHTLLMSAHAHREAARLRQRLATFSRRGVLRGRVVEGAGPEGRFAEHRVEQVGRSKGDGKIHFHDRDFVSRVLGGTIELEDGSRVAVESGTAAEVWIEDSAKRARARAGAGAFAEAYPRAKKARGFQRSVDTGVQTGDEVWVTGLEDTQSHVGAAVGGVTEADPGVPVVSSFDPRPWLRRHALRADFAAVGFVLVSAACTVPMLWPPRFGLAAKIGAVAAIAVFNLLQLFLNMVREGTRVPSARPLRGVWREA